MNEKLKIQTIVEISRMITQAKNFFCIKDEIVEKMLNVIHPTKACVNLFLKNNYKYAYLVCSQTLEYIPTLFDDLDDEYGSKIDFSTYPKYIHEAVEDRKVVWVKNIFEDDRAINERELAIKEGYKGRIVCPLIANDSVVGFLTCFLKPDDYLTEEDIDFIYSISSLLGLSIEITKKNHNVDILIKKLRSVLNYIGKAAKLLYKNKDLDMFLKVATRQLCKVTLSESSYIVLCDKSSNIDLFNEYGNNIYNKEMECKILNSLEDGAFYNKHSIVDKFDGINSFIFYKLKNSTDVIGYIVAVNGKKYTQDDLKIMSLFSMQICIAIVMYLNTKREVQHKLLQKELELVSHQQKMIMDEKIVSVSKEKEISFFHSPSKYIGGDFCKITRISEDIGCIFICDVMGHGILSNYFVAMIKGVLQTLVYQGKNPSEIMTLLNKILYDDFDKVGIFATARVSFVNLKTGNVLSCNAGHHYPIALRRDNKECVDLDFDKGIPLGVLEGVTYKTYEYDICDYELVCLFTDGLIECRNSDGTYFGIERFKNFIKNNHHLSTSQFYELLKVELYKFTQKENLDDDILVLFLKNEEGNNYECFSDKFESTKESLF